MNLSYLNRWQLSLPQLSGLIRLPRQLHPPTLYGETSRFFLEPSSRPPHSPAASDDPAALGPGVRNASATAGLELERQTQPQGYAAEWACVQ